MRIALLGLAALIPVTLWVRWPSKPEAASPALAEASLSPATPVMVEAEPQVATIESLAIPDAAPALPAAAGDKNPESDAAGGGNTAASSASIPGTAILRPDAGSGTTAATDPRPARPGGARSAAAARSAARHSDDRLLAALNRYAEPGKASSKRDVALIEALLERAAPAPDKPVNAASDAEQGIRSLPKGPSVALPGTASRAVVERSPGTSTAGLLRRCEDFGALEGLLCRIRICADHRGIDPACPAQAAAAREPD